MCGEVERRKEGGKQSGNNTRKEVGTSGNIDNKRSTRSTFWKRKKEIKRKRYKRTEWKGRGDGKRLKVEKVEYILR